MFATAHVLCNFIDAAAHAFKEKRLGLLLSDLRSILERMAHVRYLGQELPLGANAERVRYASLSGPYLKR